MGEEVKAVANSVLDDVINGVAKEIDKKKGGGSCGGKSKDRSLLCVFFDPRTYFFPLSFDEKF